MKEFVENSASQRGECFESVLPQKGSLVGAEDWCRYDKLFNITS